MQKVDNAIIMAAGLSSRFAPLSFEKPKGLLEVKGEVLIERQIMQLKEAGINDITIVVGYMKEQFLYLEEKFGVNIVVNEEYNRKNNISTLYLVKDMLKNTYICSSDNYFTKNVFNDREDKSYYSSIYVEGETDEYCISLDDKGKIVNAKQGGHDSWIMLGHVYFSFEFSNKFREILENNYNKPELSQLLWEDLYIMNIKELPMYIKKYEEDIILEFDSLEDLRNFDKTYRIDSRSQIIKNICNILKCEEYEVLNIVPVKKGLTNLSFSFDVKNKKYIYRHPGKGTEEIIHRDSEAFSQQIAKKLELDKTFIYMCPNEGWKISEFIDNCFDFDYKNKDHVKSGMKLIKRLHDEYIESKWEFNIYEESKKMLNLALEHGNIPIFKDLNEITNKVSTLYNLTELDNVKKRLCHNDCYAPNFLINNDDIILIDWEYSGNADPGSDIGTFIACSPYTVNEALEVLEIYFGRPLSEAEKRHYLGYVGISSYYWFVWALYKESIGEDVGDYINIWYDYANKYTDIALDMYVGNIQKPLENNKKII